MSRLDKVRGRYASLSLPDEQPGVFVPQMVPSEEWRSPSQPPKPPEKYWNKTRITLHGLGTVLPEWDVSKVWHSNPQSSERDPIYTVYFPNGEDIQKVYDGWQKIAGFILVYGNYFALTQTCMSFDALQKIQALVSEVKPMGQINGHAIIRFYCSDWTELPPRE